MTCTPDVAPAIERVSIITESEKAAQVFKWIESERAGRDLGEDAIRRWVKEHWWGYLRASWLEHLQGKRFWLELDRDDFGLLNRAFKDHPDLLDHVMDRVKAGKENLDIINWAQTFGLPSPPVLRILEGIDMNSRRLACHFGNCS